MRDAYNQKLNKIRNEIIQLSNSCLTYYKEVTRLNSPSVQYDDLYALSNHIQKKCMEMLLLQAPVASDLQFVGNSLKMAMNLDRIASHIREYGINLSEGNESLIEKADLVSIVEKMFILFIDSYEKGINCYEKMNELENEVDKLYETKIACLKDHFVVEDVMLLKYLERIADHLLNLTSF